MKEGASRGPGSRCGSWSPGSWTGAASQKVCRLCSARRCMSLSVSRGRRRCCRCHHRCHSVCDLGRPSEAGRFGSLVLSTNRRAVEVGAVSCMSLIARVDGLTLTLRIVGLRCWRAFGQPDEAGQYIDWSTIWECDRYTCSGSTCDGRASGL